MNQSLANRPANISLLSLILWRVLPVIVVVQLAIGWFASTIMNRVVSDELESRLNQEAEQFPNIVVLKLNALLQTATSLAGNDLIINGIIDAQERDHYLPALFESMRVPGPGGAEVTLTDYKGRRLASNRDDVDYTEAPWLDWVFAGRPWRRLSKEGFTVAVPVMISGVAEGMIVIRYGPDQLERLLRVRTETAAVAVVTDADDILYGSHQPFTDHIAGGLNGTSSDWEIVSTAIPGFDNLRMVTGELRSTAFALVQHLGYFLWATMAICIAAVVLGIIATALMSTRAVGRFIDALERITQASDLDRQIKPEGAREFHRLASAFNRMLNALKATTASRDDLINANEKLTALNTAIDKANADLAQSKLRFELAVRGSAGGIWDWEAATDSLFWSDRLKEIVGITDEAFVPELSSFLDRVHPDDRDVLMEQRRRHLEERTPYDLECRLQKENGDYVWIHNRGQAIWDDAGQPIRMAGSADDITDRKAAELKLADYARELERSNRELDDFAHIASHDLKEPLRAIYNHASFLLEDYQDKLGEDGEKRLDRMIKLSQRMEQLIADLLYFARLGRGDQAMEKVDPNAVIADVETRLADTLKNRNARIVADELPPVIGNPAHIAAVLQNLINNGTKYNDALEKIIEIGLAPAGQEGTAAGFEVFYVRDNGIGIDARFQDDVFKIFKRLNSDKTYGAGTGAGLSFVKKIIGNHGGRIWLQSKPGEGSTFFFTLKSAAEWQDAA